MKFSALTLAVALAASSLSVAAFAQTATNPAPAATTSKSTKAHKTVHHKAATPAKTSAKATTKK